MEYITCEDERRKNEIFRVKLYPALTKMIESIIRRYGLFVPSEEFDETFFDCLSFLITKVNNFDVSRGTKVYSYCGTVCKRYLIARRKQDMKNRDIVFSYDAVFPTTDSDPRPEDNSVAMEHSFNTSLINRTIREIEGVTRRTPTLSDNERKIGYALITMLRNWEEIFQSFGSKKFNKISVYFFIREITQLTTKEIREGLKIYKGLYFLSKKELTEEGE